MVPNIAALGEPARKRTSTLRTLLLRHPKSPKTTLTGKRPASPGKCPCHTASIGGALARWTSAATRAHLDGLVGGVLEGDAALLRIGAVLELQLEGLLASVHHAQHVHVGARRDGLDLLDALELRDREKLASCRSVHHAQHVHVGALPMASTSSMCLVCGRQVTEFERIESMWIVIVEQEIVNADRESS